MSNRLLEKRLSDKVYAIKSPLIKHCMFWIVNSLSTCSCTILCCAPVRFHKASRDRLIHYLEPDPLKSVGVFLLTFMCIVSNTSVLYLQRIPRCYLSSQSILNLFLQHDSRGHYVAGGGVFCLGFKANIQTICYQLKVPWHPNQIKNWMDMFYLIKIPPAVAIE